MLKLQQAVRPGEVNRTCQSFLSFVKTSSVRMCRVTVSVRNGIVILWRSELIFEAVGWNGITDRRVMGGREIKRALQAIQYNTPHSFYRGAAKC